jgi:hypothetical protein
MVTRISVEKHTGLRNPTHLPCTPSCLYDHGENVRGRSRGTTSMYWSTLMPEICRCGPACLASAVPQPPRYGGLLTSDDHLRNPWI